MLSSTLSPYTISLSKYWLLHDKPIIRAYTPAQRELEEKSQHQSMLFHVQAGDYISTLTTILRFFEESIADNKITPEMRRLQVVSIGNVIKDLLYLDKHYSIVRKENKNDKSH